jgi:hypothetical protein
MSIISVVSVLVSVLIAVGASVVAYLGTRRISSGRVATSEAEVLWKQSQAMYESVIKERDEARAQRDKLMSAQADQVIPILSAVLQAVQKISTTIGEIDFRTGQNRDYIVQAVDILRRLDQKYGGH